MKSKSPCELSEKELNEIVERCNSTTRGPWRSYVEGRDHLSGDHFIMTGEGKNRGEDIYLSGATTADQDFIAHAKQDVPRLVNEVGRLKQLLLDNGIC